MNDHDEDRVKGGFMLKYENIEIKIERYCYGFRDLFSFSEAIKTKTERIELKCHYQA